jgi:hypothetical protein
MCKYGICEPIELSFLAGTKILLPSGTKNIELIKEGDYVLSFENGKIVERRVYNFISHQSDHYYILRTENREVKVTGNHEFFTPEGFVKVSEINGGEEVYVLEGGELTEEEIIFREFVQGDVEVYDFAVEGTHTYFANGFAVHNQEPITIQRGSYPNPFSEDGIIMDYQSGGPILHFEFGESDRIPDDIGGGSRTRGSWKRGHSWKFETFVYPVFPGTMSQYTTTLRIYSDDGVMMRIREYPNGDWTSTSCLEPDNCIMQYTFNENTWYQIQVYLFNDPVGTEDDNPTGVLIDDGTGKTILELFGGEGVATMHNMPPGTERTINGTTTIYPNELTSVRELGAFSVEYENPTSDNSDVQLSMRNRCEWKGINLPVSTWDMVDGEFIRRRGSVQESYDPLSLSGEGRRLYRPDGDYHGGVYKCKESDFWPSFEGDCPVNDRYEKQTKVCCLVGIAELDVSDADQEILTIENYESGYSYVMNYLPGKGNTLCAYYETTAPGLSENLYTSTYTNEFCDENTGIKCCYCRPGYGCTLDCLNERNISGSDIFTLPFPASGIQPPIKWEIVVDDLILNNTFENIITMEEKGDHRNGWKFSARLSETAGKVLYKQFTIPLNLHSDFGLYVPEYVRSGNTYEVRVIIDVEEDRQPIEIYRKEGIDFDSVQCLTPGKTREFYNRTLYPGTYKKGVCEPGSQVCRNLTLTNYEWVYESTNDYPVTPGTEECDGMDNDCNGIIDDVMSFDDIINIIIQELRDTGKLKTPYEVTGCGCFVHGTPEPETCNGIDDDCDGTIDNIEKTITINTCDQEVKECIEGGSPLTWCYMFYNSSTECEIGEETISETKNVTINTCTKEVEKCLEGEHIVRLTLNVEENIPFTYDDCKHIYEDPSCYMEDTEVRVLGDTCRCSRGLPVSETCNGVDDDCDGMIDDVEFPESCECAYLTDVTEINELKGGVDNDCDGKDSNCDGTIDEEANRCGCSGRTPQEIREITGEVTEICDGIDNDCDGLVDENFQRLGKPCGYGLCTGGVLVCGVHGDEEVCNTTVNPEDTFESMATKLSEDETCDLQDNDCDSSIDENCECTPSDSGLLKVCGYESGIYYKNLDNLEDTCETVMEKLSQIITWAEAPEKVKYRMPVTVNNAENFGLGNYPVGISLNTRLLNVYEKIRKDGKDLRITPKGEEKHLDWTNSTPFDATDTKIWFKTDTPANSEKYYYVYYGDPTATYEPLTSTEVMGLDHERNVFLLCHFDGDSACEGNIVPKHEETTSYSPGKYVRGVTIDGGDSLSYPTSENFNKERGTLEMWVKPGDTGEDHYLFYSEDFEGNPQFGLHFNSGGTYFEIRDSQGLAHEVSASAPVIGEWTHIAATWDTVKGMYIYINGVLGGSKEFKWNSKDTGTDVHVGNKDGENQLDGVIDELAIYSGSLSENEIRKHMRYFSPQVTFGDEETLNETQTKVEEADVYAKCVKLLENVTFTGNEMMETVLSLCDSVRICQKTGFPVNPVSECTFGTQECSGDRWGECTGVMPKTETCDQRDNDCNGIKDDVAFPETCACSNGGQPGDEVCNGIDDDCNGMIDDVKGYESIESTHCGCFDQVVNITQKNSESEIDCNGIDDNCNGIIDEGLEKCACAGTIFGPEENTWSQAISSENCNDIDDDCNGAVDDPWQQGGEKATESEYLGGICSPVNSRCVGGMYVCSNDGTDIVCNTMSSEGIEGQDLRENETCNGIDDDCDGVIDNVWGEVSYKFCQCHNGIPGSEEACDGIDNDCDGLVDNGLADCGCSFELEVSINNINQLAVLINTKKTSGELCNNMDDDCNGIVDDDLEGECFCSGGFSGNPFVRTEFCNGVDDDCDGTVDNVANPETCACYEGAKKPGESEEVCDRIDNDCNGLVDEDWPTLGGMCGFGVCSGGIYECSADGNEAVCSTGPGGSGDKSSEEICGDEVDNNCDGVIDENCVCDVEGEKRKCSMDEGECKEGVQTCTSSGWSACIGGVLPSPEICDKKDNNCNGIVDDVPVGNCGCYGGSEGSEEACNGVDDDCDGTVDNLGKKSSVEGTKCGCYDNLYGKGAKLETCNGIDDDCDGKIDDVKDGESIPATRCACYNGALPEVESCNKIDDNCNEEIDEDWPTLGESCGQGICTGISVCSEDGETVLCNGELPETEVCDGKDNNCDGKIDEGCFGPGPIASCENGIQDGDEEGVDCGGSCPNICPEPHVQIPPGTWIIVFAVLVIVIVIVGILLVFLK